MSEPEYRVVTCHACRKPLAVAGVSTHTAVYCDTGCLRQGPIAAKRRADIQRLRAMGMTLDLVAEAVGVSKQAVASSLKRYGDPLNGETGTVRRRKS